MTPHQPVDLISHTIFQYQYSCLTLFFTSTVQIIMKTSIIKIIKIIIIIIVIIIVLITIIIIIIIMVRRNKSTAKREEMILKTYRALSLVAYRWSITPTSCKIYSYWGIRYNDSVHVPVGYSLLKNGRSKVSS